MTDDLIRLFSAGRRLAPDAPRARRIALLAHFWQSQMKFTIGVGTLLFAAAVFFRITADAATLATVSVWMAFMWTNGTTAADRAGNGRDYSLTLPASREELFWMRFLPGACLVFAWPFGARLAETTGLAPALWSLVATGPLAVSAPEWSANATLLALLLPALLYGAAFFLSLLRLKPIWTSLILIGLGIPAMTLLMLNGAHLNISAWLTGTLLLGAIAGFTLLSRRTFLRLQIGLGNEGVYGRESRRPVRCDGFFGRARGVTPISGYVGTASALAPAAPFVPAPRPALSPEAARRKALRLHTFAPRMIWVWCGLGTWALTTVLMPSLGVVIIHGLIGVLCVGATLTGFGNDMGPEEYALLLPASRSELFLARIVPVFLGLAGLALFDALVAGVLRIPDAIWHIHGAGLGAKGFVGLMLTPTAAVALFVVGKIGAPRGMALLAGFLPLAFIGLNRFEFLEKCDALELATLLLAIIVLATVWSYRAFLTKEVTPPVVGAARWGAKR